MHRVFAVGTLVALGFSGDPAWGQTPRPGVAIPSNGTTGDGTPATAAPPSTDDFGRDSPQLDVKTRDGAEFHGSLVEEIPGQYVTILLATGEARRIAWNAIAGMTKAGVATAAAVGEKALVRFDADDGRAQLEKFVGSWQPVCSTPCEGYVSVDGAYRVGGDGIKASDPFRLSPGGGKSKIAATVGTEGRAVAGGLLAIGGGVVAYIGALTFLFGAATESTDSNSGQLSQHGSIPTTGAIVLLVGAAVGVTGLVLLLGNKTSVHLSQGRGQAGRTPRLKLAGPFSLEGGALRF